MPQEKVAEEFFARFRLPKERAKADQPQALYTFNTYGPVINMAPTSSISLGELLAELGHHKPKKDD